MNTTSLSPLHRNIVDCLFGGSADESDSIFLEGVIYNLENPESMTKDVYLQLLRLEESMELSIAKGEDCNEGFNERLSEVARLMDAAPWAMCPDDGCVLKAAVEIPTT